MVAILIPHFSLPFNIGNDGKAVVNDQDSVNEISDCVHAIVRTNKGFRPEKPEFGITDQVFTTSFDKVLVRAEIQESEPRVQAATETIRSEIDALIENVLVELSEAQLTGSNF